MDSKAAQVQIEKKNSQNQVFDGWKDKLRRSLYGTVKGGHMFII